jgi:hypothetical protein
LGIWNVTSTLIVDRDPKCSLSMFLTPHILHLDRRAFSFWQPLREVISPGWKIKVFTRIIKDKIHFKRLTDIFCCKSPRMSKARLSNRSLSSWSFSDFVLIASTCWTPFLSLSLFLRVFVVFFHFSTLLRISSLNFQLPIFFFWTLFLITSILR